MGVSCEKQPMKFYRHYTDIPDHARGGSVALGNFDGVHRGHRAVLTAAARWAKHLVAPLGVVTFDPHPRRFFRPQEPPFQITPLSIKTRILGDMGVDVVYALPFDDALSQQSPAVFVDEILLAGLGVRCVVTGEDFMFGQGRRGTITELAALAAKRGFDYEAVPVRHQASGPPYASTHIRECLRAGNMKQAAALLGRVWEVEGVVEKGEGRGRHIGFPTANICIADSIHPAAGVYAVWVALSSPADKQQYEKQKWHPGVANYGRRPTFGSSAPVLEVHILDDDADLYGQSLRVAFIDFIRSERRFADSAELRQQIDLDCQKARTILAQHAPGTPAIEPLKDTTSQPHSPNARDSS